MYALLITIIILLIILTIFMYIRTSATLKRLDKMLSSAQEDSFSENSFTEARLSKLESKMYRYLSSGKTARSKIEQERGAIKALVSDISHQTKTPISNILLYTELLCERQDTSTEVKEMLWQIRDQTDKLNFLIQSLIKTSRLENGTVTVVPEQNSIKVLIENLNLAAAAREKEIRLVLNDIPELTAEFDIKWTSEAIANIVDNAIKYTPRGGEVKLSAKEYEMFVRIDIADSGIGISEDETAKIFARFYRSSAARDEKGVGIGLYLARKIINMEGGYIKVRSALGKGSVFSVFLPKKANLSKV